MKYKLLTIFALAVALGSFVSTPVGAALPSEGGGSAGGSGSNCASTQEPGDCAEKTAFAFGSCGTEKVGIQCLFVEVIKFLSIGVGIAVVAGIAIGGIQYATSQGNPSGTQKGITTITNTILGLVLYFLMFAILQFLIPGGIFT